MRFCKLHDDFIKHQKLYEILRNSDVWWNHHKDFVNCSLQNLKWPDIVYIPINSSLRFYKLQFSKSHTTSDVWSNHHKDFVNCSLQNLIWPDIVYVPINLSFCKLQFSKSHTISDIWWNHHQAVYKISYDLI